MADESLAELKSRTEEQLAVNLLRVLTAETLAKAELFDYLCWVEETQQIERVHDAKFLFCALDYATCWGDTYKEAVANGWRRDEVKFKASLLPEGER